MTKRALSLLLTLVMVLSLCVPALAAEDFEAEAPAEVVEEAPEAPEAPVAPEAEEPADEPVVDEPAAEEPVEAVADEPEMASIMPEDAEDLPYLVALGKVSKLNHWKLENLLAKVEPYKTKVDANELYVKTDYTAVAQTTSPAKSFLDAYEEAHKCLDAINGEVVDIDVTDVEIESVMAKLKTFISKEDGGTGQALLIDTIKLDSTTTTENMTPANLYAGLKAGTSYSGKTVEYKYPSTRNYPNDINTVTKDTKFTDAVWTMSYSSDYLEALTKAQTEIKAFDKLGKDATYKDFAAVRETVLAAAKLESNAAKPEAGDADALANAIKAAKAVKDSYLDEDSNVNGIYAKGNNKLFEELIPAAEALLNTTLGLNGLQTNVRFNDVKRAIKDINEAITLKSNTFKFEKYKASSMSQIDVTVTIAQFLNNNGTSNDGTNYGYAIKIGDFWYNPNSGSALAQKTFSDACIQPINTTGNQPKWGDSNDYPNRLAATIPVTAFKPTDKDADSSAAQNTTFSSTDKITISFFQKSLTDGNNQPAYGAAIDTQTLTFSKDAYFGPIIDKAWVANYNATSDFEFTTLDDLDGTTVSANQKGVAATDTATAGSEIEIDVQMDQARSNEPLWWQYVEFQVLNGKKTVLTAKLNDGNGNDLDYVDAKTWKIQQADSDPYMVAGDMTIQKVEYVTDEGSTTTDRSPVTRSTATLTVAPLSKWSAVKEINKALAAAKKLDQNDYVLDPVKLTSDGEITGRPDIKSVADAFKTINNDVTKIETAITSTTVPNTLRNRQAVMSVLNDIGKVYGYLKANAVDNAALTALMAEVAAMKDDEYTYDSWGKMQDALEDAKDVNKPPYLQSKIDAAYKALKAAKDALVKEGEVDKTALKAAITSAKALKEADYTKESWAANKATIDAAVTAAEAVVANTQATQAQVNAALNTLTAAVGKLEKVGAEEPVGPQAPTTNNGTGWVLFENEWYFFKKGALVANYWVGKIDGASQWDSNWYYVGADGKMLTGMQYVDDLHGGMGWYFLQPTNTKGEIGKMLTGWQWVGGQYGECYFSKANGSSGKCTWSELMGNWNTSTNSWSK